MQKNNLKNSCCNMIQKNLWLFLFILISCSGQQEEEKGVKYLNSQFVKMDSVLDVEFQTYHSEYFEEDTVSKILIDYYDPEFYVKDSSNNIIPLQTYIRNTNAKLPSGFLCIIELKTDYPGVIQEIRLRGYNYNGKKYPKTLDLAKLLNNRIFVKPYAHIPGNKKLAMVLSNN